MATDPNFIITRTSDKRRLPRGWLVVLSVLITAAVLSVVAWWMYPQVTNDLQGRLIMAEQGALELAAANESLERALVIAERDSQITGAANDQLRDDLKQVERQLSELNDDIEFYQRLLEAGGVRRGLGLHELLLENTSDASIYRYRLTLSQNLEKAELVSGTIEILLNGMQDGDLVQLNPVEIASIEDRDSLDYEFKYFQRLTGTLIIPAGFSPLSLDVTIRPSGRSNRNEVAEQFEWSRLIDDMRSHVQE